MSEWYEGVIKANSLKAQRLKEQSNLGERFNNRTFGNFDKHRDEKAFKTCLQYAERDDLFTMQTRSKEFNLIDALKGKDARYRNGLILFGGYGTGKTHLAAAIANNLVDKGVSCMFGTFSDHLEKIRQEFNTDKRVYLEKLKNIPMLVIDDIGQEKKSEWTQQILYDVINYRYDHLSPVVITTNLDVDALANHVGGAVMSRLMEMCFIVQTAGKDMRDMRNH